MNDFIEKWLHDPVVNKLIITLIGIIIIIILIRFIQRALGRYIQETNTRYRARKIITFVGYLLAAFLITAVFSDKLGGLNIALGVAGAGIAFALQEVIMSLAGWFAINFSNFYKTGDRVQIGGVKGDIIDIGLLRTTLMEVGEWVDGDLYNGRVVRVANSFVFKDPVYNYSGDFPFLWDEITIPVRYGSDFRFTYELLRRTADEVVGEYAQFALKAWESLVKKFMIENAVVEPLVTMTANQDWMTYTVRFVVDYKKRRTTKDKLFKRILEEIESNKEKVSIASSSMEINLLRTPPRENQP